MLWRRPDWTLWTLLGVGAEWGWPHSPPLCPALGSVVARGDGEGLGLAPLFPLESALGGSFFFLFSEQQSRDPLCWQRPHKKKKEKRKKTQHNTVRHIFKNCDSYLGLGGLASGTNAGPVIACLTADDCRLAVFIYLLIKSDFACGQNKFIHINIFWIHKKRFIIWRVFLFVCF